MENEIWKPVKNFEGRYSISNKGRVKSHRKIINKYGTFYKNMILSPGLSRGYYHVILKDKENNKKAYKRVHILVAEAFLGYEQTNETVIHHIDHNKLNNNLNNLKIVNKSEHIRYHNSLQDNRKCDPEEVKKLYLEGYSERAVAQMLNIGKTTVSKYMKRFGISRKNYLISPKLKEGVIV